jgi:hypothetical protein
MPRLGAVSSSPQPVDTGRRERTHSGRLLLRMPESLHAELADAADRDGVSLNQFITNTLSRSLGHETARPGTASSSPGFLRGGWLTLMLVVNLVVVAAAGVLAILLLVSARG